MAATTAPHAGSAGSTEMTPEQQDAFAQVCHAVIHDQHRIFFIYGAGGTGKTYLYKQIIAHIRQNGRIVLCVASSGMASLLLPGGRTAHSQFQIPVTSLNEDSYCAIAKNTFRAELILSTELIIWDEASPQHRHAIEAFDRTCQDICEEELPFGGITIVFGGDWRQTLPVVPHGSREDIIDATLCCSTLWPFVTLFELTENMRLRAHGAAGDREFANWLTEIGEGASHPDGADTARVSIPTSMIVYHLDEFLTAIFGNISGSLSPASDFFLDRCILAPRNAHVTDINDMLLGRLPGNLLYFPSAEKRLEEPGSVSQRSQIPASEEFLRTLQVPSMPPGELYLKVGCPLMLIRNLAPREGLCNGTRMLLRKATAWVLEVQILGGTHDQELAFIPRIDINSPEQAEFAVRFRRRQFPVRVAFAMSINKAQGQSLGVVGVDLRQPVFAHGQLYVALSRATSRNRLKILLPPEETTTTNIVYHSIVNGL
jgi:hypothetical protein